MKKGKLFINIATLVLSLCLMVYGVYAAKSATLQTSGKIGFIAHDAKVGVQLTEISGAYSKDGTLVTTSNLKQVSGVKSELTVTGTTASSIDLAYGSSSTAADKALYFDDLTSSSDQDTITPIELTFTVKNYSRFDVVVSNTSTTGNITVSSKTIKWTLTKPGTLTKSTNGTTAGGTGTLKIKLEYTFSGTSAADIAASALNIPTITFAKA